LLLASKTFEEQRTALLDNLQARVEPLIYKYFGLDDVVVALIEDSSDVYWPSATPETPSKDIETLRATTPSRLEKFSSKLCSVLNNWTTLGLPKGGKPKYYFVAEYSSLRSGLCLVTLKRGTHKEHPKQSVLRDTDLALMRLAKSSVTENGAFTYLRTIIHSTPEAIYILRPDLYGQWTRSAALNIADVIYGSIMTSNTKSIK